MKKVIFTAGTKVNVWEQMNNMQEYMYDNAYNLVSMFIGTPGVVCDTISGIINPSDTSLKAEIAGKTIQPGIAVTVSGIFLYATGPVAIATPTAGAQSIWLRWKSNPGTTVPRIAGFVYWSGLTQVPITDDVNFTTNFETVFTDPGASGILVASGYYDDGGAGTWSLTDLRAPMRLHSGILPTEVFRKYGEFSNIGYIKTNKLGIQSDDEAYTMWIHNSGVDADIDLQASGIQDAYDWRHVQGTDTAFTHALLTASGHIILTNANAIASGVSTGATAQQELTRFFRHGIVNFDGRLDGVNDRQVVTTLIPSVPATVTGLAATLIEMSTDSKFSTELNAALLNYNLKELEYTQKNEAIALVEAFYGEMQRVAAINLYSDMTDFYDYSGTVTIGTSIYTAPEYPYTFNAAASGIVLGGYGISYTGLGYSGMGYDGPGTYAAFVPAINGTLNNYENEVTSLEADKLDAATSVLSKTNRLELTPDSARKQYRCRITWNAPTPINNEDIKYYNVRVYKLNPLTYNAVPDDYALTSLEGDFNKVLELKDDTSYIKRKTQEDLGFSNASSVEITTDAVGYSGMILYHDNYGTEEAIRVGDIVRDTNDITYFVTKIVGISGIQLDKTGPPASFDDMTIWRTRLETGTINTRYDFNIYADQYYMVYVRAVTEYDIAGLWSAPLQVITNNLTNAAGNTLGNIITVDERLIARNNEIKNSIFQRKISDKIVALQRQVEDTPSRAAFDNLIYKVTENDTPAS